jgi:hypothetical protein
MNTHLGSTPRPPRRPDPRRRSESGWVFAASLILSALVAAVTVTYARHAILAKKSLEYDQASTAVESASRSGLERVRERMRRGDSPGTIDEGTHDEAVTDSGEHVIGEREVTGHGKRELRAHAASDDGSDESSITARADVVPGSDTDGDPTALDCDDGSGVLLAGSLTVISGSVSLSDVQLSGFFLLEEGAELTLDDVVLNGTIVTRAGLCNGNLPTEGSNRPRVRVIGGLRLLAGNELPDVAVAGPDLRFEAESGSRVEIDGFVSTDELRLDGRGSVRGMVVTRTQETIGSDISRPGHGRGKPSFPDSVVPGAERVTAIAFPAQPVTTALLDQMASAEMP